MNRRSETKRGLREINPDLRFLLVLTGLALLSRLVWVLWIHPPSSAVYSDMGSYLSRALRLVNRGFEPGVRELAWQSWGTHYLLALPLKLGGSHWGLQLAGVLWGIMSAAIVVLTYALARLTSLPNTVARFVGIVALLWFPHLSLAGFFLSEVPFCCFQLWGSYRLARCFQQPANGMKRGKIQGIITGIILSFAFSLRPQIAIFFLFVALYWLAHRRSHLAFSFRQAFMIAIPLVLMLGFSLCRFQHHTGRWGGIAENMAMNLTAGRCHNIVTQAFRTKEALRRSERSNSTRDGRRVGLPGFRVLAKRPSENFFSLRPALQSPTIRFVGYIGDADIHRKIRETCYEATGWLGQIHYSVVNLSLSWFHARHWPEINESHRHRSLWIASETYRRIYQWALWIPALIACFWNFTIVTPTSLLSISRFQLFTSMTISAIFFGDPRLRTPYDPFAILLAFSFGFEVWRRIISGFHKNTARKIDQSTNSNETKQNSTKSAEYSPRRLI